MKRFILISVTAVSLWVAMSAPMAEAQERKRTPALREQVYSQLSRAQEMADGGDLAGGIAVLKEVESKLESMNSYERAMLWNFYGFMYYEQDDVENAMRYFGKVVDEDPIPESLEQNTLYSLAQLALTEGQFEQALLYVDRYEQSSGEVEPKTQVLRAQALYQQEDFSAALEPIRAAIDAREAEGKYADENWYVLIRAIYYELGQTEQVAETLETMVRAFNKPTYWVQLANIYGQLEQDEKQLAMLEAAYQQGFLAQGQDYMTLAQSYFFNGVPFKAGAVLEEALEKDLLESDLRNLKMLAQSWIAAKETDKAVAALAQAAELSDDGELDAQRAQVLLNADRNAEAIEAAQSALAKGGLDNEGNMHLVVGMARLNQTQFNEALQAFARAKEFEESRATASQWQRYTESEKQLADRLAEFDS